MVVAEWRSEFRFELLSTLIYAFDRDRPTMFYLNDRNGGKKKIDLREIHTVTFYSPTTQRGDKTSNFEYAKGCTLSPKEVTNDRTLCYVQEEVQIPREHL